MLVARCILSCRMSVFLIETLPSSVSGNLKTQLTGLHQRIPLRGICRVEGVSLRWLLAFIVDLYERLPSDLNFQLKGEADGLLIYTLKSEVDEMFSFVCK